MLDDEETVYFVRDSSKNIENFKGIEIVKDIVHERSYFLVNLIRNDEAAFP